MQEIGGAIQRVNHPAEFAFFRLGAGFAELFAEEIVLREFLQQDILDDFFCAAIHDAHQIAAPLFFYLDLVELTQPHLQDFSRFFRGTTRDGKHWICRHYLFLMV